MIVLDTHTWLWWAADRKKLSATARRRLTGARSVAVSAISPWEVAMLVRKGRLELRGDMRAAIATLLGLPSLSAIPVSPEIATEAGLLEEIHGDPSDRIIVATALALRAPLMTKDSAIRRAGVVEVIW